MPRKSRIVFVILIVSGVLFLGSFLVLRSNYTVPIIMYHSVNPVVENPAVHRLVVAPEDFERQMRFLKSHRYNVVLLSELARMLSSGRKLSPKTIAITFDDGYKDIYTYAFPVLKKYNLHATNFVIIDEVGRVLDDRLSWDQIKEMRDSAE
jgi:peptidoglycan/xylan/chitin deacetylase (PgdA/CDA1 family)